MTTFNDFHQWLFPGDPISRSANPTDIPPEVRPLLNEIARCTHIKLGWLEKAAGLVVDGMAGLECLWYLHGLSGTIETEGLNRPESPNLADELESIRHRAMRDPQVHVVVKWDAGVAEESYYDPKDAMSQETPLRRVRKTKLGKWLKKYNASPELLHAFEVREMPVWGWEISCNPYDVLTMSHERPWTSCMRPGGEYEFGPLTDMAAGSAIMFFRRPGAGMPCGRRILRPAVFESLRPFIADGGRTYGCGPQTLQAKQIQTILSEASGHDIPVRTAPICGNGLTGQMIIRHIYSDTDHRECGQSDENYTQAYANLASGYWPEPKLDMGAWRSLAEEYKGKIEIEDDDEYGNAGADITRFQNRAWNHIGPRLTVSFAFSMLNDQQLLHEEVVDALAGEDAPSNYVIHDVEEYVKDSVVGWINDIVNAAMLNIYVIPQEIVAENSTNSLAKMEFGHPRAEDFISVYKIGVVRERNSLFDIIETELKARLDITELAGDYIVVIPEAFRVAVPNLIKEAVFHMEMSPQDYNAGYWSWVTL